MYDYGRAHRTCAKKGCSSRTFMDSDRCFDHQQMIRTTGVGPAFVLWFAFCALLGVASVGLFAWAVISLVGWVVSQ